MTGKTHAIVGASSLALLGILCPSGLVINNQTVMPVMAGITAVIGSYLPDIDIHRSALGMKYKFISKHLKHRGFTHTLVIPGILLLLIAVSALIPAKAILAFNALLLLISAVDTARVLRVLVKTHKLDLYDFTQSVCELAAVMQIVSNVYTTTVFASVVFGLFFGWFMHIVADAFNGKGIPPLPGMKRVHIMKVNSGTWEEYVWLFIYLCAVAGIIYFVRFSV